MKVIKQVSTGRIVWRESPHNDDPFEVTSVLTVPKTLQSASKVLNIPHSDLEVVDENLTEETYTAKVNDELPWEEKMSNSDINMMSRVVEDILDGMPDKSGVAQITLDRLQVKKDLRATKP